MEQHTELIGTPPTPKTPFQEYLSFWSSLFARPRDFFEKQLPANSIRHFTTAILVFCLGTGIDRMESRLNKFSETNEALFETLNHWVPFWALSIILGLVGYVSYLIGGWFYDLRIGWSNGETNLKRSRTIFLFSNFYFHLYLCLLAVINTFLFTDPANINGDFPIYQICSLFILIMMFAHSVYVSLSGALTVENISKKKAAFWFLMLPIVFYMIIIYLMIEIYL